MPELNSESKPNVLSYKHPALLFSPQAFFFKSQWFNFNAGKGEKKSVLFTKCCDT